ncbi:hypothetical protein [Rufibacter roseus]|uniref:Uncharacterized protein n=1 Tax=Rufibacter roseus TaxID=1567108 RepID=A0ABW2DJ70_9BACT|nr:hypothetical protein [Rufibacter roseus]
MRTHNNGGGYSGSKSAGRRNASSLDPSASAQDDRQKEKDLECVDRLV